MRAGRAAFACVLGLSGLVGAADVLGRKPAYLTLAPSSVPNQRAITRMIWAPGLDDGYVPQGLTVAEGIVLMSAYRSTDPKVGTGPCRVFRIDPRTGISSGFFDLPPECGHAGGLVYLGKDSLVVADTRRVYRIGMGGAFTERSPQDAPRGTVRLGREVKGSFVDFDGRDLWFGVYDKDESRSKIHRFHSSLYKGEV